jgi:hypothetical protein
MKTRKDLAVGVLIVVVALAVVAVRLRATDGADAQAQAGGHEHAAISAGSGELSPVVLDDEDARRIGVALSTVEHRPLPQSVRAVGTVAYDETRLATVSPKVEGWVEVLHVDFTGAPVTAGEPLLEVYSPMLVTAQEELILAAQARDGKPRPHARRRTRGASSSPPAGGSLTGTSPRTRSVASSSPACRRRRSPYARPRRASSSRRTSCGATASCPA